MQQPHHGFTFIELLITLAVISLLAGFVTPEINRLLERQRTAAAIASLTAHMQLTRIAAINHNRRAILCPSRDGRHCAPGTDWGIGWMLFVDTDGNRQPDQHDEVLRADLQPLSHHLRIASTAGRQQLRYLPDGSSAGSNLTLALCNSDGLLLAKVIVNNMGRPRSEYSKAALPCPA